MESGIKHGTVTAVIEGVHVELTTLRKTYPYSTEFSDSIEEDVSARDFTINAIAYDPYSDCLIDPTNGLQDLQGGIVRAVGDPNHRFLEDPLRLLRMIRFGPAEGRVIDPRTSDQAQKHLASLEKVSVERVQHELKRILTSNFPAPSVRMMLDLGILAVILPELLPMVGFEQNQFHTENVFDHTMTVLAAAPPTAPLRFAALFHDTGKPHTLSLGENGERHFYLHEKVSAELCIQALRRLKFSHDEIDTISLLVRHHMRPLECGPPGLRRIMRDLGPHFDQWRQLKIADAPPVMDKAEFHTRLSAFDHMVCEEHARRAKTERKLAVDGNDLIALGFTPGIALGMTLKQLEEVVLDNPEENAREPLLERARKLLKSPP